jgi:hypothetical protein
MPLPAPAPTILDLAPAAARAALAEFAAAEGLPSYRVGQLHRRLWTAPVARWDDATELPLPCASG